MFSHFVSSNSQVAVDTGRRYFCHECHNSFYLGTPEILVDSWQPCCTCCGGSFVEECPAAASIIVDTSSDFGREAPVQNTVYSQSSSHGVSWGRYSGETWESYYPSRYLRCEEDVSSMLPVASSRNLSQRFPSDSHDNIYSREQHNRSMRTFSRSFHSSTASRTESQSSNSLSSSIGTWQHMLHYFWNLLVHSRASGRETSSAHGMTTEYSAENEATSYSNRRVRRRTVHPAEVSNTDWRGETLHVQLPWILYQVLGITGDPREYVLDEATLYGLLEYLSEQGNAIQGSPPAAKSYVESLEGQLLTEQEAKEAGSCAVCWEEFRADTRVVYLPCSHLFCKECICIWLKEHSTCPTCRHELPVD